MGEYLPLEFACDDGDLTIDGFPMRCAAWAIYDLTDLWLPAAQRGRNRIIPGAAGVIVNPRRKTETRRTLIMGVTGGYDQAGAPYSDPWIGLKTNIDDLVSSVFDPPTLPLVSRTALLTEPDGTTSTAQVQCSDLEPVKKVEAVHVYTFELTIPMGEFV